jgi:hypothetical protein
LIYSDTSRLVKETIVCSKLSPFSNESTIEIIELEPNEDTLWFVDVGSAEQLFLCDRCAPKFHMGRNKERDD